MDRFELLIAARCGQLGWMCCLNPAQLLVLARLAREHDDAELLKLLQLVCACAAGSGKPANNGTPDLNPTTPVVIPGFPAPTQPIPVPKQGYWERFKAFACSPSGIKYMKGLAKTITFIRSIPGIGGSTPIPIPELPPGTKIPELPGAPGTGGTKVSIDWDRLSQLLELAAKACEESNANKLAPSVGSEIGSQITLVSLGMDSLPQYATDVLKPVLIGSAPPGALELFATSFGG